MLKFKPPDLRWRLSIGRDGLIVGGIIWPLVVLTSEQLGEERAVMPLAMAAQSLVQSQEEG
jgi:hypothetical protein